MGITNQLMIATKVLHEACRTGRNFAGYYNPSAFGKQAGPRDLSELFDVQAVDHRLRNTISITRSLHAHCPELQTRGLAAARGAGAPHCGHTRLIPIGCLSQSGGTVANASLAASEFDVHGYHPGLLFALEPSRELSWQPTLCSFKLHSDSAAAGSASRFNAIHFNVDTDWLLFICSSMTDFVRFTNSQLSDGQVEARVGANGSFAPFVRRVVIPQFLRAMRAIFKDLSLPVVVCTSLGKLSHITLWIAEELETAVLATFGVPVVYGATQNAWREVNAMADLRVLVHAESAVLWPGSTFPQSTQQ
jgi:hypothetical protein